MTCRTALCTSAYVFSFFVCSHQNAATLFSYIYCYFLPLHKFVENIIATVTFILCALCTASRVTKHIKTDGVDVLGVTSVDDELFALLERDEDQVAVYSINNYRLLRHLNMPGYEPSVINDMTSCVRRKCLYMSEFRNKCIHIYALASTAKSKLPLSFNPNSLSVTPNGNLLVACHCPKQLVELSVESGKQVRQISLQEDIKYLWHGVQLANGQFVVCHGSYGSLHRVCMVGDDGRVTRSYGGKCGSGYEQLDCPCHLALDEDSQLIFVADQLNDRVVVSSPRLEFVRYIGKGVYRPCRLYFDQSTRRLYVAHAMGDVSVIQLLMSRDCMSMTSSTS